MTAQVNGASKRAVSPQRVLVAGGSGRDIPVHMAPKPGEMQTAGISAARALGHAPTHDLESGLFTVWPDFSEAKK
jgi:hypothetical protein